MASQKTLIAKRNENNFSFTKLQHIEFRVEKFSDACTEIFWRKFDNDGTELDIVIPYGIAIHPRNGDIYVTDAKNYVSSGVLHCYSREGVHKWSVRTGDIPAHMVFLERKQTRQ